MSEHAAEIRSSIAERIAARDRAGAVSVAHTAVADGAISIDQLYCDVLIPLLVDTGESWQSGATPVWVEHYTTAVVRTIVESLVLAVERAAAPRIGRTAVLACPSGEQHDLGLRMLNDRLILRGWDAHFLGADTPADDVVGAAQKLGADLVALSAATHYNMVLLRSFVDLVKRRLPGVRIGVGGPAFDCDHHWPAEDLLVMHELGIDDDPEGACELPIDG